MSTPKDVVPVCREDANNYCRILRVLGVEEEGDPVAEVKHLQSRIVDLEAQLHAVWQWRSGEADPPPTAAPAVVGPVILQRGKYHVYPVGDENQGDWEWFDSDVSCDDCIDALIVRADSMPQQIAEPASQGGAA